MTKNKRCFMNDYEMLVNALSEEVPIKEVPLYEETKRYCILL